MPALIPQPDKVAGEEHRQWYNRLWCLDSQYKTSAETTEEQGRG